MQNADAWHALFQQALTLLRGENPLLQFAILMVPLLVLAMTLELISAYIAEPLRRRRAATMASDELPPLVASRSREAAVAEPKPAKAAKPKSKVTRKRRAVRARKTKSFRPTIVHRDGAVIVPQTNFPPLRAVVTPEVAAEPRDMASSEPAAAIPQR